MKLFKYLSNTISTFISSNTGSRFFNIAYSIGAAVVICGVLFKLLALPGSNALLAVGLGTEVLMFILTAFDMPADTRSGTNQPVQSGSCVMKTPESADQSGKVDDAARLYVERLNELSAEIQKLKENTAAINSIYANMLAAMSGRTGDGGNVNCDKIR